MIPAPGTSTVFPDSAAFRLVGGRVPADLAPALADAAAADGLAPCEIVVEGGRIARLGPAKGLPAAEALPVHDLRGGLVLPRFVDMHTHLDKGHIIGRAPNPDGTFGGARNAVMADREANWDAADVRRRMDFALRCALAHGTGAIRTHLDSIGGQTAITWPVFREMRAEWRGRIELQAVALFPFEVAVDDDAQFREIVATVARHGGVLGGLTHLGAPPDQKLDRALDRMIEAAAAHGLDLDLHVDESGSPDARSLGRIAEAAIRHRFRGRITCGHCCSLALAPDAERERTIARVAEAGIAIVSLPMVNLYLQDRQANRTPRWRGVAPLHELASAGVPVAVASDNTRDPFYAYGDLDMVEVFREATRILHLDHCDRSWAGLLGRVPADLMRLGDHGRLVEGGPADLVLLEARDLVELATRPQTDRIVLAGGLRIASGLPDLRELDPS